MLESIRIDKWLWTVRVFKTRTQAADACKGGKVKIGGQNVKASKEIKAGEIVEIQLGILKKVIKIKQLVKNRVGAKLVPDLIEDLTPVEEYEKMDLLRQLNHEKRDRGAGRPTKKERRDLGKLKGQ